MLFSCFREKKQHESLFFWRKVSFLFLSYSFEKKAFCVNDGHYIYSDKDIAPWRLINSYRTIYFPTH